MAPGSDVVADALRPPLRPYDVDEETFESLVEMVVEAAAEDGIMDSATELSAKIADLLEPFLLAFGAEPTSIPGAAMQVAVSLCGLPDQKETLKPIETVVAPKVAEDPPTRVGAGGAKAAASKAARAAEPSAPTATNGAKKATNNAKAATNGAKESGKPAVTLASFCSGPPAGRSAAQPSGVRAAGGYPAATTGDATNGPKSLGALWATQADPYGEAAAAWEMDGGAPARVDQEDDEEEGDEETTDAGTSVRSRQQQERQDRRERRLAAAAAIANAVPLQDEDLNEVAAHGLRETKQALSDGTSARVGRGTHVEGKNSRNLHMEGLSLTIMGEQGTKELLKDTDLHLSAGHVYGLVGKNGTGKTTLLRRLVTRSIPGLPTHLKFGYVAQELAALQGEQTALEFVLAADEEREALLKEREEIESIPLDASEGDDVATARAKRFVEIEQRLETIDADGAEDRAREVLIRLGLDEAAIQKPVATMSGGGRMRMALARALCGRPDILLLDEPTNHLDLHGVIWLQEHLRTEWGADAKTKNRIVFMVSHDRSFLDACATDIIEIHNCKLRNFVGDYSSYADRIIDEQRRLLLAKSEFERQEKAAKKDLRDMKKSAREHQDDKKVRQLKSKEKKIEKGFKLSSMREFGGDMGDIMTKLREDSSLRFRFPEVPPVNGEGANLMELDGATIRQGGQVILRDITLTLEPRSRIAIVGPNGAGKSTLMRALVGELKAEQGSRSRGRVHPAYCPGFVSQNHLERQATCLHGNCVDFLRDCLPDETEVRNATFTKQSDDSMLRAHLGNFGLGKDALKKVGYLSGGQKARLSLATATWFNPTVLLLDEPTNHLDVDSLDALSLGLQAYEGAVVVVSHSRGFLEALCDELWVVQNGGVKVCPKGEEAFAEYMTSYMKSVKSSFKR